MELLVLGGTRFVGRALVAEGQARGWRVSALNRGLTGRLPDGVRLLTADRTSYDDLRAALDGVSFDLVVDTWAGAPKVADLAAGLLTGRAGRFGYVSSRSVYRWPPPSGSDESAPVVDAEPDADATDYAADKRGGELAVLQHFPDALLARAGMILGPHEDIGRLPAWLDRISRGGRVPAPGRPQRPLQYVDARDLAGWMLGALEAGYAGPVNAVSRPGHCTMGELLDACVAATGADTELVWIGEAEIEAAGVEPWTQLPCWVPEQGELAGLMDGDTSLAAATGLQCRPVVDTVRDTREWLQANGMPAQRADRSAHGLPPDAEVRLLAGH